MAALPAEEEKTLSATDSDGIRCNAKIGKTRIRRSNNDIAEPAFNSVLIYKMVFGKKTIIIRKYKNSHKKQPLYVFK